MHAYRWNLAWSGHEHEPGASLLLSKGKASRAVDAMRVTGLISGVFGLPSDPRLRAADFLPDDDGNVSAARVQATLERLTRSKLVSLEAALGPMAQSIASFLTLASFHGGFQVTRAVVPPPEVWLAERAGS